MINLTWNKRLLAAKKRGKFTRTDYDKAADWPMCAVGEKLHLAKNIDALELDNGAFKLGMSFCESVGHDDVKNAEMIYKKIQKLKVKP